jgi:Flp pilus assembly protein TadG
MSFLTGGRRDGQVLVQVAMLMIVFFIFMAIAIDVGHMLTERRRMQNAADAGALAGAWEICFGDPARAEQTAREYAVDRNHAQVADVTVAEGKVTVYAREATGLYLASIFGVDTADINAMAAADCGVAVSLCGLAPLSFNWDRWTQRVECDEEFYVWNDSKLEEDCYIEVDGECIPFCEACVCALEDPPDNEVHIVGPGDRGWLLLPRPERPYDALVPQGADNCGRQTLAWIDNGGYTGEIPIDPNQVGSLCLPGQPGVDNDVRLEIERDHAGELFNILLWDDVPCSDGDIVPAEGACPGTPYHIVDTGCVQLDEVDPAPEIDIPANPEYFANPYCMQNVKVVKARKLCEGDCGSECGTTSGGAPQPWQVRAVSLIE